MSSDLYLTDEQEKHIVDAIAAAERRTSGEIRVHIEAKCEEDPLIRAERIFHKLGMDQTDQQNGVLIYIAAEDHKVAIYAGRGIHKQTGENFWKEILNSLVVYFKKDDFERGIAVAVEKAGEKLSELYPYQQDDLNELSNNISYRDNRE